MALFVSVGELKIDAKKAHTQPLLHPSRFSPTIALKIPFLPSMLTD